MNNKTVDFEYNANGIRTRKVTTGTENMTKKYHLDGTKLLAEETNNICIIYHYDADDIIGATYGTSTYYYEKDALGNVISVYLDNNKMISYTYDAWGNCTAHDPFTNTDEFIKINPIRWKGHYFDTETGLYYINGNYYDPEIGRFINDISGGTSYNESGYAVINPVRMRPNVHSCFPSLPMSPEFKEGSESNDLYNWVPTEAKWIVGTVINVGLWISVPFTSGATLPAAIGATTTTIVGVAASGLSFQNGISYKWSWNEAADAYMWGSITGGISGGLGGYIGNAANGFSQGWLQQGLWNAVINMTVTAGDNLLRDGELNPYSIAMSGVFGFAGGSLGNIGPFNGKIGENIVNPIISGIGLGAAEEISNILYDDLVVNAQLISIYYNVIMENKYIYAYS